MHCTLVGQFSVSARDYVNNVITSRFEHRQQFLRTFYNILSKSFFLVLFLKDFVFSGGETRGRGARTEGGGYFDKVFIYLNATYYIQSIELSSIGIAMCFDTFASNYILYKTPTA